MTTSALPLLLAFSALSLLAACSDPAVPVAPARADFSAELIDLKGQPGPPKGPEGACWQEEIRPAVIETVTEQLLVTPETRAADGAILTPAAYTTETKQRMVSDRGKVWFRSPCPEEMTPEFIATLQRALKARGLYMTALTGEMDPTTRNALRRYQLSRGLDSGQLSLAAAQELGLVTGKF